MKKVMLDFEEEFIVKAPLNLLYDTLFYAWKITEREYEKNDKINVREVKDKNILSWNFKHHLGINKKNVLFKEIDQDSTKVKVFGEMPDIKFRLIKTNQPINREGFLVGIRCLFRSIEFFYNNRNNLGKNSKITDFKKQKKPFYYKDYHSVLELDTEIEVLYTFLLKYHELFNEINQGYPELKKEEKKVMKEIKYQLLVARTRDAYGDMITNYYFDEQNSSKYITIKYWVPYWYMLSGKRRVNSKLTFISLKTRLRAFDKAYQKHFGENPTYSN